MLSIGSQSSEPLEIKGGTWSRFVDILEGIRDSPRRHEVALRHPIEDGKYTETTFLQFSNTVGNAAILLQNKISGQVVGYISDSHASYAMNLFALMKIGVAPVMLSPRNPIDSQVHLLLSSGAGALVYEPSYASMAKECQLGIPGLVLLESIPISKSLYGTPPATLAGSKENNVMEETIMMMHSSGTTSAPKLIKISNRYALSIIQRYRMNPLWCQKLRGTMLTLGPLFHLFGLVNFIWFLTNFDTIVFPNSISPNHILALSIEHKVTLILLLPFQVKQLAEYCESFPENWPVLSKMNALHFGGAPLPEVLGRSLFNHKVTLINGYGTTETGFLAGGLSGPNNHDCRRLTLAKGIKYRLVNVDGNTAQLMILSYDENLASDLCLNREGYILSDRLLVLGRDRLQFEVLGRTDDTLVHPSGEKTYPVPMESKLVSSKLISQCVILNNRRMHNCLLIQLNKLQFQALPPISAINQIYETIQGVNDKAPKYSRIDQSLVYILPLDTDKVLPVTVKGNIARAKSESMFHHEIQQLYAQFDQAPEKSSLANTQKSILLDICDIFHRVTSTKLDPTHDFFSHGLDSLSAVKFKNQLSVNYSNINTNTLYDKNTAELLADHILSPAPSKSLCTAQREVDQLVQTCTDFRNVLPSPRVSHPKRSNVLVTGANGSLGSHLINQLLTQPWVNKIYAFARAESSESAASRIREALKARQINLNDSQLASISFFSYDKDASELKQVHVIYHVAWRMDFLRGLSQFKDCIETTVNLLRISATSPYRPTFHFVSSIGAAIPVTQNELIPEVELNPQLSSITTGYNLSKLVTETICLKWEQQFNFKLHIHRVGQVVGDTNFGIWNETEHMPLLIKSSQIMTTLPKSYTPQTSWIPVDIAAQAMVELHSSSTSTIHHIANPNLNTWDEILNSLKESGLEFQQVDPETFMETLRNTPKYQDSSINPIAPLTQFWDSMLVKRSTTSPSYLLETTLTQHDSTAIRSCPRIDTKLIRKFIQHWVKTGFLIPKSSKD